MEKKKFILITTIPLSLNFFKGQINLLKEKFEVEVISSEGELLESFIKRENVKGYVVNMKREISIFYDIRSLFQLVLLLMKLKPDVVHASTPKAGLLGMMASWIIGVKYRIYYVHGLRYQGFRGIKSTILKYIESITCFFSNNLIAVSKGVKAAMVSNQITKKKIGLIWNGSVNGIDGSHFSKQNNNIIEINHKFNYGNKDFVFGFTGRLVKDKGIEELIHAFNKLNLENPKIKLLLVGNFEKYNSLDESLIHKIRNNKNIKVTGFVEDVRPYLRMMNIFVFPSYREGFGVSIMEANAMSIPVIATNIIGCNEIIEEPLNGLLISPKSEHELYNSMKSLLNDEELREKISSNAREVVIKKYEQKELWNKTMNYYFRIIKESN